MAYLLGLYSNLAEFYNLEYNDIVHLRWIIKSGNFKSETDLSSWSRDAIILKRAAKKKLHIMLNIYCIEQVIAVAGTLNLN